MKILGQLEKVLIWEDQLEKYAFFLHQEKDIPFLGSAVLCPLPWQVDSGLDSAIFHPCPECLRAEHNLQSGYVVILSRDTLYKVLIGEYG